MGDQRAARVAEAVWEAFTYPTFLDSIGTFREVPLDRTGKNKEPVAEAWLPAGRWVWCARGGFVESTEWSVAWVPDHDVIGVHFVGERGEDLLGVEDLPRKVAAAVDRQVAVRLAALVTRAGTEQRATLDMEALEFRSVQSGGLMSKTWVDDDENIGHFVCRTHLAMAVRIPERETASA